MPQQTVSFTDLSVSSSAALRVRPAAQAFCGSRDGQGASEGSTLASKLLNVFKNGLEKETRGELFTWPDDTKLEETARPQKISRRFKKILIGLSLAVQR